jgi:hypothetical protein
MQLMRAVPISADWNKRLKRLPVVLISFMLNTCRRVFYAVAIFIWPCGIFKGIRTLDFSRKTRSQFNQKICEALVLVEQNDTRRFERVQRQIRLIVYDRWLIDPLPASSYFSKARVCMINLSRFDFSKRPKFETAILASLIIYLATHGHLHRSGLLDVSRFDVSRIEALCGREERRFLMKLGYDLRGFDISKYSNKADSQYVEYWKEYFDKLS